MNNQMPFYQGQQPNININDILYERLNNRIDRIERHIRIIENRLNRLENNNLNLLKNYQDDNGMYMI